MKPVERYTFTETLMKLLQVSSWEFSNSVKRSLDHYLASWRKAGPATSLERSASRAHQLNMLADTTIEMAKIKEDIKHSISCRSGCAHCCRMFVSVTSSEADLLIMKAGEKGIDLPLTTLKRQAEYGDDAQWALQPPDQRTCVFLSAEEKCVVYEDRPLACRKYFSLSDPDICEIGSEKSDQHEGQVLVWHVPKVEILATAAFTYFGVGAMPNMLLAAIERVREAGQKLRDNREIQ